MLLGLLINCKQTNQSIISSDDQINSLNSTITDNVNEGIEFLKEFYTKYYGEYRDRKDIENYVSDRILKRMDSLTNEDNLILDYDPFIQGQDWDTNMLIKSLSIIPLKNKDEYRVSFLLFEERDTTNIDVLLKKNEKGKLLIYSILNDEHLSFSYIEENESKSELVSAKLIYEIKLIRNKGEEQGSVSINVLDKKSRKSLYHINFQPEFLFSDNTINQNINYFDNSIKFKEGIENYHSFILDDFNFDGLEDFAIINYEGSNAGPQYAYFLQTPNKQFLNDNYLTSEVRFFPTEINKENKTLTISHPVGCCKNSTYTIQLQNNQIWKEIFSEITDMQ